MDESTPVSRHPDSMRRAFLWALLPSLALLLIAPAVGDAQVATNITSSALPACPGLCGPGVTIVTAPSTGGTVTTITGGARPGNGPNLFHSFGQFNVGTGDIANFFNETGLPTSNILSRVTGGNPSQIYGTIQTTDFPGANLFLMNPAGVLFGPSAALDLGAITGSAVRQPGSFYATTADYLNLGDGNGTSPFYADPAKASVLSVAPVVAFGFLGPDLPAPITVQGSMLQVPEGHTLSLVGGDITVQAETFEDGTIQQAASLRAPGGQINLVSVASPGEVLVPSFQTGPNINGAPFTTMGTVTLKEGTTIDVSGQLDEFGTPIGKGNSGTVFVRGGQLVMDASAILANTVGAVDGASTAVDVQVSQDVTLINGAAIITITSGPGGGGDIHMTARRLTLENASGIITDTSFGDGVGGDLVLNVGTLRLLGGPFGGSLILSSNFTGTDLDGDGIVDGTGVGGNVTIQGISHEAGSAADSVVLSGGSQIASNTFVSGDGGRISITAESLDLNEASTINSSTFGTGRGGDIVVGVQQASLLGGATITSQAISASSDAAAGGTVTLQGLQGAGSKADSVAFAGQGSGILSDSFAARPGGIEVHAKTVSLTDGAAIQTGTPISLGTAGNVTIDAGSVGISRGSHIASMAFDADAGQVTITANALTLDNGSIDTSTLSESGGRGGDVVVNAGAVSLTNGARINSQTVSTGRAGDITMTVGSLTLANHAVITSSSTGPVADAGDAGSVTITASGSFTSNASTIVTSAENAKGGDIGVTAQSVALSNGAVMSASSLSPLLSDKGGDAGTITIHSGSIVVLHNSVMSAEASQASGGDIMITAPKMVRLTNSRISTSVFGGNFASSGGNITIDPQFVILQNSLILASAVAGRGGNITIDFGVFLVDPNSVVDASGALSLTGTIQNVGGQLTPLSQQFSSAAALLFTQRCAADPTGQFSSFVQTGRDGVPQVPGALSPSPLSFLETLTSGSLGLPVPNWAATRLGLDSVRVDDSIRFHSACRS